jgi:hypothetical protein
MDESDGDDEMGDRDEAYFYRAWGGEVKVRKSMQDFGGLCITVMTEIILAKFNVHEDLKAVLLGTGTKVFVYHSDDLVWGVKDDGLGSNLMGKILGLVRLKLAGRGVEEENALVNEFSYLTEEDLMPGYRSALEYAHTMRAY